MERMWLGDARLKYWNSWIVAVNVNRGEDNKAYGDICFVSQSRDEAYDKALELKKSGKMGHITVMESDGDPKYVGGLEVCRQ